MVKNLLLIGVIIFGSSSCNVSKEQEGMGGATPKDKAVTLVDIHTFQELMEQKEDLQIVDVRTPKEYELSSIPRAVNIDYWSESFTDQVKKLHKEKPVAVYCAAGKRSAKAAAKLQELGFEEIYDLDGGIRAWHTGPVMDDNQ